MVDVFGFWPPGCISGAILISQVKHLWVLFFAGVLCGIFTLWCVGCLPAGNLVLGDKQNDCMSLLLTAL